MRTLTPMPGLVLCSAVWLATSGCFDQDFSPGSCVLGCAPVPRPQCVTDSECRGDDLCVQEVCRPRCKTDDDCSLGAACKPSLGITTVCLPGCRNSEECAASEWCNLERHSCQPWCSDAGQCQSGFGCSDGFEGAQRCRPECQSDADCVAAEACYEGRHGERYCGAASCRESTDCRGLGEWCGSIGDMRHCRSDCMDSAQCPEDFVCSAITSQVGPPFTCRPTCESDVECPDGSFCLSEEDHAAFCAIGCNDSADCPETERCVHFPPLPWGLCAPGCNTVSECSQGSPRFTCVDGACKAPVGVLATDPDADASVETECGAGP